MGGKASKHPRGNDHDRNNDVLSSLSSSHYQFHTNNPHQNRSQVQSNGDNYNTLEEVTQALREAGLESSNLIVGIDFTKSNEWTGARSFEGKSLHFLGEDNKLNPYEQAISIIGRTLSPFDEDNLIPCYGFGDSSTHDEDVFSFYPDNKRCQGFEEVLARYRELVPRVNLAGPTSFAPIVEAAIGIVDSKGGQCHVLVIIADGQVTRSVDTRNDQFSPQEHKTIDAIVKASEYPLSIILVGVGDGPWNLMRTFDDFIPARAFDNCQFVNFTKIMVKDIPPSNKEAEFALEALMEIPSQYRATMEFNLLGRRRGTRGRVPLPPPIWNNIPTNSSPEFMRSNSMRPPSRPYYQFSRSSSASSSRCRVLLCVFAAITI